ncbi:hypothetical protein [Trichloromonas sp.]
MESLDLLSGTGLAAEKNGVHPIKKPQPFQAGKRKKILHLRS